MKKFQRLHEDGKQQISSFQVPLYQTQLIITMDRYFLDESDTNRLKPAICALILRDGKILMIKRAKEDLGAGFWTPVTGSVMKDEEIEHAIHREVMEEVSLKIELVRKVWQCQTSNHEYLLHWWIAKWSSGEVVPEPSEVEEFRWLTVPEILQLSPVFADTTYFFKNIWSQTEINDT